MIVGVAEKGFTGDIVGQPTDLWIPVTMQPVVMPNSPWLTKRAVSWLLLMGRLAPGVSLETRAHRSQRTRNPVVAR